MIPKAIFDWFNSFFGRKKLEISDQQSIEEKEVTQEAEVSVSSLGKPTLNQKYLSRIRNFSPLSNLKSILQKLAVILLIFTFLLILFFTGTRVFTSLRKNSAQDSALTPTPTPLDYQGYKPSIWAEDKNILKLEEDINILEKELGTNIRDTSLTPPILDFEI